mgnify:CR=1 FL=1
MKSSIVLKDIDFSYNQKDNVLSITDLNILDGEKVFIYGPSGSGKSTLLNLIAGVISPNKGSLNILGENINKLSMGKKDRFRGDHIGFVFQNFNLITYLTIYENILLPLKSSKKRFSKIVGSIDSEIKRIATHLKIDAFLDKRVTQLSIGQQQRVAVARALVGNPEIVIADEPTSSLDEDVTDSFMQLLIDEHRKQNFTLLFVSHDRRLSKFFDREIALFEINQGAKKDA